jgi:hypothetical protein
MVRYEQGLLIFTRSDLTGKPPDVYDVRRAEMSFHGAAPFLDRDKDPKCPLV